MECVITSYSIHYTKLYDIPLILMGYLNPVYQYGVEAFCQKCAEIGIDGTILPDLPLDEFDAEYRKYFEANNLHNILLITPQTSEKRIRQIDEASNGFMYMVSSSSTTGASKKVEDFHQDYRITSYNVCYTKLLRFSSFRT